MGVDLMQTHDENKKQQPESAQEAQLSETWRALLGSQAHAASQNALQVDPAAQVQPQASDPWNALVHKQGMETVDLQRIRLHDLHPTANDDDVEHALNLMQEAVGLQNPHPRKTDEV